MTAFCPAEPGGTVPQIVRERRFLQQGHVLVPAMPAAITTILGSCVAVCMWDPRCGVGGMNHFMLPLPAAGAAASPRFGNVAMEELVTRLRAAGARLPFLRARVYGGACMFPGMRSTKHLGTQNSDLALEFLTARHIEIVHVDVGGNRGRKVVFNTDGGLTCLSLI
jgi:chemotaxis protein CheD